METSPETSFDHNLFEFNVVHAKLVLKVELVLELSNKSSSSSDAGVKKLVIDSRTFNS